MTTEPEIGADPELIETIRQLADLTVEWIGQLGETMGPVIDDLTLAFGLEVLRRERQQLARTRSARKRRRVLRSIRATKAEITRAGQRRAQRIQTNEGDSIK
jgi:hypothetical protein